MSLKVVRLATVATVALTLKAYAVPLASENWAVLMKVPLIGVPVLVAVSLNCFSPAVPARFRSGKSINELPSVLEAVAPVSDWKVPDSTVAETVVTESNTGLSKMS